MSSLIEKVYLTDGSSFLLFNPKYTHAVDGRILAGRAVSEDGQPVENSTIAVDPADIAYTVGVKRNEDFGFDEDRSVVPPSLR